MSLADHGGFDLVVELSFAAMASAINSTLPAFPPSQIQAQGFNGSITPKTTVVSASVSASQDLTTVLSLDGTVLTVDSFTIAGVNQTPQPWMRQITLTGSVAITDRLEVRGTSLVVDLSPQPILNQPTVVSSIDQNSVLAAPLVSFQLADIYRVFGEVGYQAAVQQIMGQLNSAIEGAVRRAVGALGVVTLAAGPPAATGLELSPTLASLRLLYTLRGSRGNPSAITRSQLLFSSLTGAPVDAAAIVLSNACFLRDFIRPAIASTLGIPESMFGSDHPCQFTGPSPISIAAPDGIEGVLCDYLWAGIDGGGVLKILFGITATGPGGTFTIDCRINAGLALSVGASGSSITFTATPLLPVSVASDIAIAAWVYVVAALTGGSVLVVTLALIDAFAGFALNLPVAAAIGGALTAITVSTPLPGRFPALVVRSSSFAQPDAEARLLFWGPLAVPDPFLAEDLIFNLV